MSATIDDTVEILAAYESWKEDTLTTDPDVSLTAYIRVLEAGQPDPRIAEIHTIAVGALDDLDAGTTVPNLAAYLRRIVQVTDPALLTTTDLETFQF